MNGPLETQVGGKHYKTLAMQPIEFASVNGYDPSIFSTLKYVTRHASKHGLEDLNKAGHFIELRVQLRRNFPFLTGDTFFARNTIPIEKYIQLNGVPVAEASFLTDLHFWAVGQSRLQDAPVSGFLLSKLERMKQSYYPQ